MSGPLAVLLHGDCLDRLRLIDDESVDAIVTDPPYGLANTDPKHVVEALTRWAAGERDFIPEGRGFMGKAWDAFVPPPAVWDECARILKPGGHLLAFAGSRTFDLMTLSIRFAGFDIRDSIAWLYGSGFPKSMDVSKAIDKALGAEGTYGEPKSAAHAAMLEKGVARRGEKHPGWDRPWMDDPEAVSNAQRKYEGGSDAAREWQGWGTALKPAFEPIVVARKPLGEKTVAANVLAHGTGALNIDATRITTEGEKTVRPPLSTNKHEGYQRPWNDDAEARARVEARREEAHDKRDNLGRWPANVILDESQAAALDEQSGTSKSPAGAVKYSQRLGKTGMGAAPRAASPDAGRREVEATGYGDAGGASRFFYVAKAPKSERPVVDGVAHPTVKPLALMRYLIRLVTPPGGLVVDPFAGSGSTLEAAHLEGMDSIGVEMTPDYWPLIEARIERMNR